METEELERLISSSLRDFHSRRLQNAQKIKAKEILQRKNPYLYRALGIELASDLIETLLTSHLKESDETIFGDAFFEPIARIVSGGTASPTAGVDFFVETDEKYLAVAVKSGPNVFNASQKRRQNAEFNALRARLQKMQKQYDPLLGHCYGRYHSGPGEARNYRDSSGQEFWQELTGDPDLYIKLMELMRDEPLKYREAFQATWAGVINRLTLEFSSEFCQMDGRIDWVKLVQFVSAKERLRAKPKEGPS